ncbi:MAG: class F sortase [Candidatus Saccharibacteria bacterium]|nr:class F sortase [Candidatus Saccharibacteria bacterium]
MGLKINKKASRIIRIISAIIGAIVVVCMIKILVWEASYYQNKSAETRNQQQAVITDLADANNPSEIEVTQEMLDAHQTYTTSPRYIIIPRLHLKARVMGSNVTEYVMPVPDNIADVAWYSGSGNPGQGGNILMSGISQGATKPGAFANLDSLEKDDEITLVRGDDETFTYIIREIQIIDKEEAKNKLPLAQERIDDKETLALISARRADEKSDVFNSIIIVKATIK